MIRVVVLTATDQRRGAEVFARALADELGDNGFAPTLMAIEASGAAATIPTDATGKGRVHPHTWRMLARALRTCDVCLGVGSHSLAVGALACRAARRPFVYRSIGDPAHWGQARAAGLRVGLPLRQATTVVALFPRARDYFIDRYGVAGDRVTVIPTGADAALFRPPTAAERDTVRSGLGLRPQDKVAMYVGSLSPEKNPQALLPMLELLGDDARLVVVGDGPLRPTLEARAAAGNRSVDFLGLRDDVPALLHAADVVVLPSLTEGISGVAIQAGLSKVPVVATDVGGMDWVIDSAVTGRLVSGAEPALLATAVEEAVEHRVEWGEAAYRRCRDEFDVSVIARRWASVLAAAAGS